jgi:diguanylate cyclase (GGDEF)-like protein
MDRVRTHEKIVRGRKGAILLDGIVRHRGIARGAVAVLTVGLSALALLAVETNTRTAEATTHVRASEAVSDQWDEVFLHIAVESEALTDYVKAQSALGRRPLESAIGSATPNLDWLARSDDVNQATRARSTKSSYAAYTESLELVVAAGKRGNKKEVELYADQAALSASTVRKQAVSNAAGQRRELVVYLDSVEARSAQSRVVAIALGATDCVLLAFCGLILLGYQRRTERQAKESTHRSLHDGLTGIPNRTLFADRLAAAVRLAERRGDPVGLLVLDLDRFKEVNDTLGHQQGDSLLCTVAERLTGIIRGSDSIARLGGDEFGILLQGVASEQGVLDVAQRVIKTLGRPVTLDGAVVDVGCSIGAAIYPQHGRDPTELLKNADIAMYVAKRGHLGASLYSADADHYTSDLLVIFGELRHAVEAGELVLFYQPKVQAATGTICGVEALVRWQHPGRGLLGPSEFISAAERSQLILPLTNYVIAAALDQLKDWVGGGLHLPVSVNVDAMSLLDREFPDRVAAMLAASGVPAELLTLEITESAFISDGDLALTILNRLRQMGVRLALDDFGTGYSAMAYLQQMPLHELKIDRRFITHLLDSRQDRAITRAVIDIAHALDMQVVGEGVEDAVTLDALRDLKCDEAQGYFICRPVPVPELMAWLAQRPDGLWSRKATADA